MAEYDPIAHTCIGVKVCALVPEINGLTLLYFYIKFMKNTLPEEIRTSVKALLLCCLSNKYWSPAQVGQWQEPLPRDEEILISAVAFDVVFGRN